MKLFEQAQLLKSLCAALGVASHPAQRIGGQHMQPVQFLGNAHAALIGMQHACGHTGLSYALHRRRQGLFGLKGRFAYRCLAHRQAKELFH